MSATAASRAVKETDPHWQAFEDFAKKTGDHQPPWLMSLRKAGISHFAELGFPTTSDEDWRFTNVAPVARMPFKPIIDPTPAAFDTARLSSFPFGKLDAHRLVFVNGRYCAELSQVKSLPVGIEVMSLSNALERNSEMLAKNLGHHLRSDTDAFVALNTALFQDGAFIHVPNQGTVDLPVHLVYINTSTDSGATSHVRNLIVAGKHSHLTVIESHIGLSDGDYVSNIATELVAADGAHIEHVKFQSEGDNASHLAALDVHMGRSVNLVAHSIVCGAKLSRYTIRAGLHGEGIDCILNGLYLTRDEQLADHHMVVEHAQPRCNSHEYFNGILADKSKGVFHGRILVRPVAQKTDAKQTNKNLLLSNDATVDTKPQLEIYADDVKCTHGATIGQLEEEAIFYLRARGISAETAKNMLIHAFAGEIIDRVRSDAVRPELDQIIWDRLEALEQVAVRH